MKDFVYKTQAEIDAMTSKELGEYLTAKNEHETSLRKEEMRVAIEEATKNNASKEAIEAIEKRMNEQIAITEKQLLQLKALEEKSVYVGIDRSMTPIKAALEQNKDRISALKSNGGKFEVEIEDVTKATHNPTDIANRNQLGQLRPGVSEIPYQGVYMEDTFMSGTANTEYVKEVEQKTVVRDAKNVAACATSTHNTKVTFDVVDLQMKKLRDFTHVCIDMMEDYSFVDTQIRKLINTSLQLKKDYDLLLGDGTGANINGVDSYASTFSATSTGANYSGKVANAQVIDLLVVAGAQIKAFGGQNFFMPNYIHLNPVDATLLGLLKSDDKNYITAGVVNASVFRDINGVLYINGMRVVENPNVPQNEAYIYDGRKGTFYRRKGVVVEFAYENGTNFESELVTVKAYERCNLWVSNNDSNAFMHIDDIAAGVVAITAT